MKKGKTQKLNAYKSFKVFFGTVDSKNLKSVYINLQTWAEPKKEFEKPNRVVSLLSRDVKNIISSILSRKTFRENFIVDLDLRHSGISLGKKSFMNLEITLFLEELHDFKSYELKKSLESIVSHINKELLINNDEFTFTISKNEKKLQLS
jgi:hypothetical protein